MKILFSTVVRTAPVEEGGALHLLDWPTKVVKKTLPLNPFPQGFVDPNPRGNTRGGRGIALWGERVVVAQYHTLRICDLDLNPVRDISHSLMVGLHEVFTERDGRIWVAATAIDAALEYDLGSGELLKEYWPREMPGLRKALGLDPLEIDKEADNRYRFLDGRHVEHRSHLHLNAVSSWRGDVYALFHKQKVIANLDADAVAVHDEGLRGAHNLLIDKRGVAVVNDTYGRTIRMYDLAEGRLVRVIDLGAYSWTKDLMSQCLASSRLRDCLAGKSGLRNADPALPFFVRGLDRFDGKLFVGLSPASVLCIDEVSGELLDAYCHSRDVRNCIHGLKVLCSNREGSLRPDRRNAGAGR